MCASYGLDPREGGYKTLSRLMDEESLRSLQEWVKANERKPVRPTGKNLRNLNPIVRDAGEGAGLELGWWGYLAKGEPVKWPSINTKSERLKEQPGAANGRVLVPATEWWEKQKPSMQWVDFATSELFLMAAVTRDGTPAGGSPVTCYSLVMQPARSDLAHLHDRMPLLIPESFYSEWLDPGQGGSRELIEAAIAAGQEVNEMVRAASSTGPDLTRPTRQGRGDATLDLPGL